MNRQFAALVRHFFGRFFDVESTSPDADSRTRVIQLLGLLSVPGLMISFFMLGDHPAGSMFVRGAMSEVERVWLRVGDRYVFVAYGMVAMGLLMAFKWDALFPDRRDYLILTSLPISPRRWFAAKVLALFAFLSLFIVAINLFSLLLVPRLVAEQSRVNSYMAFPDSVIAHAAGTLGGSIFAALFFGAIQGVLINVLTPEAFKRISPRVQMISIAVLVTLLMLTPLVKDSIPRLAQLNSPLLDYFPLMWFLGLYEALIPGGSLMPRSIVWAYTAFAATAIAAIVFAMTYFLGYRRYSKKILESVDSDTLVLRWWKKAVDAILDRTLLRHPAQRGTFHFIEKMSSRTAKHRILTALYTGIGIALALSSLFVLTRQPSTFPFRLSPQGAIEAPLILAFVLIAGLRATFNVPAELNANWMFQTVGDGSSPHFLKAVRKWVFFYRIIPLFAFIAVFEFVSFDAATPVLHLTFDLVISAVLIEAFFFMFKKVPFTCSFCSSKIQLVIAAGAYLIGFTMFVAVAGGLKRAITAVPVRMTVFLFVSFVVLAILEKRRRNIAITYDDNEAALLSLSVDRGYWRTENTRRRRVSKIARSKRAALLRVNAPFQGALQDFRYGARILWKAPALSATAVVLIALVIGLNTTIYSIVHALITRPAPSVQAKNLVQLVMDGINDDPFLSYPEYLEFAAETKTLRSLIGYGPEPVTLGTEDGSYGLFGAYVAGNYFEGLRVQIVRGRGFIAADERLENSGLVAVISYRVWQEQFRGVDDVVGRSISVNGHPATVIGVAAPLFQGAGLAIPEDVWIPAVTYFLARGRQQLLTDRNDVRFGFLVLGQIQPNASLSEAQAEFATISARLSAAYPTTNKEEVVRPKLYSATVNAGISHGSTQFLALFSVITTLTLIIVCANVANLLLARAVERQRETALRQSLGASRARILRILITEGVAISAAAWATASIFAYWVATYAPRLIVPAGSVNGLGMRPNHMNMDFSPDVRVLAYAMLLAFIGTVFFCIAPALRMWNQELLPGLKTGEPGVVRGRSRLSGALVVVQLAFTVVLLTSAGLAYRSLSLIDSQDVGFNKENLLLVTVNPTLSITNREANLAFLERVRERFRGIAGVQNVSYVRLPPPYSLMRRPVRSSNVQTPIMANINFIGPDYLRVLGLTPKLGREFSAADNLRNRKTAIVNEDLARALWPGQSPLGQTIPLDRPGELAEIVGVTPNAHFSDRKDYFLFLAEQQDGARITGQAGLFISGETTFYVRYTGSLDSIGPAMRAAVRNVDDRVPVLNMRTMQTQLDRGHDGTRTVAAFLSVFSGGSLLIAALGQYAVIAFEMKRRSRELGIRVALGASGGQIQASILREGFMLTGLGLLIGFALSATTGLAFRGFFTGVTPTDARTYFGVFLVLATASLIACYLPARRASRADPLVTLRYE